MKDPVSVVIPVRNGGRLLERTLAALRAQRLDREVELLVCDSGSTDGSVAAARRFGAALIEIPPAEYSHGGTRNLLLERASGTHVALLTQDAEPADEQWLSRLLGGFELTEGVGLVFGPYQPRPAAGPIVARELHDWFAVLSPDGNPRIDRLAPVERTMGSRELLGPRGYFTDANGCVLRSAWEQVPFRDVPYAEDHALAHDMLRAGYAKVYLPEAAVVHSHTYSLSGWLRRSFDEARGVREIYDYPEPASVRRNALKLWGAVGADLRWRRGLEGTRPGPAILARSTVHHAARVAGAVLGARADRLPPAVVARLSLERRGR